MAPQHQVEVAIETCQRVASTLTLDSKFCIPKGLKSVPSDIHTRPFKARDFEGTGGPEDKAAMLKETNPGSDEIRDNIRSGGYGEGQNRKG